MLAPGGRFVIIGGRMRVILATFAFGPAYGRDGRSYRVLPRTRTSARGARRLAAAGELHPVVDAVLPLAEVPEALRRIGAGDVHGKLVIDPTR